MVEDKDGVPSNAGSSDQLMSRPTLKGRTSLADLLAPTPTPAIPDLSAYADALRSARAALEDAPLQSLMRSYASREALNKEINDLRQQISQASTSLEDARKTGNKSREKINSLEALVAQLKVKEDLGFLLTRVNERAQEKLTNDEAFRSVFAEDKECRAFVMSVDIRRSTELMLKARAPSLFADFISSLTKELYSCVVGNNGVFDKFTGDGVLAFFPEDFSGKDFGYSVVKAADECHKAFSKIYRNSRGSFTSILKGIGLGIGIDYGTVRLLRVAEGLTVVGVPVVYACRLSGSEPGQTLLNQPAYEVIAKGYGRHLVLEETSLNIKHEGEVLAYSAALGHEGFSPEEPSWMSANL